MSQMAEVAAGWKGSPLRDLWNQLLLLDKYLTILEKYKKKHTNARYSVLPLSFPDDFDTPYIKVTNLETNLDYTLPNYLINTHIFQNSDDVLDKLKLLLSGDDAFVDNDYEFGRMNQRAFQNDNNNPKENVYLKNYLSELSSRQNLDFADQLWQLIIGSNDYAEMTDCIHAVFKEVAENNYKLQVIDNLLIDKFNS